jgi:hypothetical protein
VLPLHLVGDVEYGVFTGRTDPGHDLAAALGADAGEHHVRPSRHELRADLGADAAVTAGHQHRPAVEIRHASLHARRAGAVIRSLRRCRHPDASRRCGLDARYSVPPPPDAWTRHARLPPSLA